jgi:acyl carrier protein
MTKQDCYRRLESALNVEPDSLRGSETVKDLERRDSMAVLNIMVQVNEKIGVTVSPEYPDRCKPVADLTDLVREHLQP